MPGLSTPTPLELRELLDRLKDAVQIMVSCAAEMEYTGNARFSYETYPTGFLNWLSGDFTLQGARKSDVRMPPERQEEYRSQAVATVLGAPIATVLGASVAPHSRTEARMQIDEAIKLLEVARDAV